MQLPLIRFSALTDQQREQLSQVKQGKIADIEDILQYEARSGFYSQERLEKQLVRQIDSLRKATEIEQVISLLSDPEKTKSSSTWGERKEYTPTELVIQALARALRRAAGHTNL